MSESVELNDIPLFPKTPAPTVSESGTLTEALAEVREILSAGPRQQECTCTIVDLGSPIRPAEWEQNPWCEKHPDLAALAGLFHELEQHRDELLSHIRAEYERAAAAEHEVAQLQIELAEARAEADCGMRHGLPEQDWCQHCDAPRDIVDLGEEVDVQTIWGTGPEYTVIYLKCGHSFCLDRTTDPAFEI